MAGKHALHKCTTETKHSKRINKVRKDLCSLNNIIDWKKNKNRRKQENQPVFQNENKQYWVCTENENIRKRRKRKLI